MNDMWKFNIKEALWRKVSTTGEVPEKRSNHSFVYIPIQEKYVCTQIMTRVIIE